jgi:charged multivesicular body protein 2A
MYKCTRVSPGRYKKPAAHNIKKMSFLFGGTPPTTSELASRYKTVINRSIREIDREHAQVRAQEKSLMAEIRRCAETNHVMARQKAKSVVRARAMMARFSNMKSQLQEITSRISSVRSTEALETAVKSANRAMCGFNTRVLGSQTMATALREFEKGSTQMTMQTEVADELLDTVFDDDNEEEADDVVQGVLEEVGVGFLIPSAQTNNDPRRAAEVTAMLRDMEGSLEQRMARMRAQK